MVARPTWRYLPSVGCWSDSCLLPEVLIVCHAHLRGVVCEQHAHDGLVLGKLQGSDRVICNSGTEVVICCFQPRSKIGYCVEKIVGTLC